VSVIRATVIELLADGPHRTAAARLGGSIRKRDGATIAVDLLDAFVAERVGDNPAIHAADPT
jgi:UDP:flavonoid glycosyltransferase YjiC (YdhE family)